MTTATDKQISHLVQELGETATLANSYFDLYMRTEDTERRNKCRNRWGAYTDARSDAELRLFRTMTALNIVHAVSDHFTASIQDKGNGPFVQLRNRETGEVIE